MTARQIARDAAYLVKSQPSAAIQHPTAADPIVARMDAIQLNGQYDRTEDGLRRSRQGAVGGVQCMVQVATAGNGVNPLASETLLIFWNMEDGHQRRLLVTGMGDIYMETGRGAAVKIGSNNKYFSACAAILKARAN